MLKRNLLNIPGWRTNRRIVVFESDDWGTIRMPSLEVYKKLLKGGIGVDKCHFCRFDSVETVDDLSHLFEVLTSIRDLNGNNAIFTANTVVANPDFEKIKEFGYNEYFYKRNIDNDEYFGTEVFNIYNQGIDSNCFLFQSHGREHVNVARWMHYLRSGYAETLFAFSLGVFGISTTITSERRKSFLASFDFENDKEEDAINNIAIDGLKIFESTYGYPSKSFIAPNYTWGESLERVLKRFGVEYIQGGLIHRYSLQHSRVGARRIRSIGSITKNSLLNLSRNAHFEPSQRAGYDWVGDCLKNVEASFRWGKPAIISTHRVNYVGSIEKENRDSNLRLLRDLLKTLRSKWQNVEFMTSEKLGDIIKNQYNEDSSCRRFLPNK